MKADRFLLVRLALVCLFVAIACPLLAQESGSDASQRIAPRPHTGKKIAAVRGPSPEEGPCRNLLKPLKAAAILSTDPPQVENVWRIRFTAESDDQLRAEELQLRECVTDLPNRHLRRVALNAYILSRNEIEARAEAQDTSYWTDALEKQQAEHDAELEKQQANFLVAAKFAAAVYKENEQRKEEELNLLAAFNEESRRYRNLYDAVQQVLNVAGQLLNGSQRSSLPAFADVPMPQLIRVQTPVVPRALHCSANTTPNLSMSSVVSTSTTWINCWQY